ncbi:hypothetical protein BTO00_22760, partial [Vibrio campbellii]|uniref:TagA domain-containing protein n=1 Tax=Vibrio campbellii TaxID=680 RepID=UPI000D4118DD
SDGDGLFDGVELAQFSDPNDANHPIYLGQLDTDNDGILNGLDSDLDGNGTEDKNELYVTLNSGVLAGNVDRLPIPYISSNTDGCPASASPSQTVGNIALVYHDADYGCSYPNTSYSATQYTVNEGISYHFNTAIPLYQIGPHQLAPTAWRLNETYPMLRLTRDVKYDIYEVILKGSDWVATKLQTIEADDIPNDGWQFIDIDLSQRSKTLTLMAIPIDRHIFNDHFSELNFVRTSDLEIEISFINYVDVDSWRYRIEQGAWLIGTGTQAVIELNQYGEHQIQVETLSSTGEVLHQFDDLAINIFERHPEVMGKIEIAQNLITDLNETSIVGAPTSERDLLVYFTPDTALQEGSTARIIFRDKFGHIIASRPMLPPSLFPDMADQILTKQPLAKYSEDIWSAFIPWKLVTFDNRNAQIEVTTLNGDITQYTFEMPSYGPPSTIDYSRIETYVWMDESEGRLAKANAVLPEDIMSNYFSHMPTKEIAIADYSPLYLDYVVDNSASGAPKRYYDDASHSDNEGAFNEFRTYRFLKHFLAMRLALAEAGHGMFNNFVGENHAPHRIATQVAYGYFKNSSGDYDKLNNTSVAAGFRGWSVFWSESNNANNAWAHEVAHGYGHAHWTTAESHSEWIDEYPYGGFMSPDLPQVFDIVLRKPRTWYRVNGNGPVRRTNMNGTPWQVNGVVVEPIHDPMNSGENPNAVNFYAPYLPAHNLLTQQWFSDGPVYVEKTSGEVQTAYWDDDRQVYRDMHGGNDPIIAKSVPVFSIFGTMAHQDAAGANQIYPIIAKRRGNVFEMTDPFSTGAKDVYEGGQYFLQISYDNKADEYALIAQSEHATLDSPFTAFNLNVPQSDKPTEVALYFSPTPYPNINLADSQLMHSRVVDYDKIVANQGVEYIHGSGRGRIGEIGFSGLCPSLDICRQSASEFSFNTANNGLFIKAIEDGVNTRETGQLSLEDELFKASIKLEDDSEIDLYFRVELYANGNYYPAHQANDHIYHRYIEQKLLFYAMTQDNPHISNFSSPIVQNIKFQIMEESELENIPLGNVTMLTKGGVINDELTGIDVMTTIPGISQLQPRYLRENGEYSGDVYSPFGMDWGHHWGIDSVEDVTDDSSQHYKSMTTFVIEASTNIIKPIHLRVVKRCLSDEQLPATSFVEGISPTIYTSTCSNRLIFHALSLDNPQLIEGERYFTTANVGVIGGAFKIHRRGWRSDVLDKPSYLDFGFDFIYNSKIADAQDVDLDGLSNDYEESIGNNPYNANDGNVDSDNDGIRDALELLWNLNPHDNNDGADSDSDGDGIGNLEEIIRNTDPLNGDVYDGDGDGVLGINDINDNDPLSDSDSDSIADIIESQNGLDPLDASDVDLSIDNDNDNMADIWETILGLNVGVDDSLEDLDGDGIDNITELNNGNAPNNPNDPIYGGNLDTDNDDTVNGLDTDLDGDGTEDNVQPTLPVLTSSVLNGNVGTVINDICNDGPSEEDKHEAIYLVQANPSSGSSGSNNNCYMLVNYAYSEYEVATTINPLLPQLPHYRIAPPATVPASFLINPTKLFIKADIGNYALYQVVRVNNGWTYAKVMDIAGTNFNPNGFVFIDRKFNEITSDVYIVMVPAGTDMSGVTVDTSGAYNTLGSGSGSGSGGSTGSSSDTVLNLDDPASGTYVRDGVLEVGTITLPGDITVRPNDVAANWPSGQAASSCSGPDNSEYAHTLYLAVGADFKFTDYGCYPITSWSHHDFDVTVFLANVAGEGVY